MAIDPSGKAIPFQTMKNLRPVRDLDTQERRLREVAEMYEKQFLGEMIKAMRGTVKDSGLIPVSQGERIFRDELDGQYSEQWAKNGGIGLADLIYQQMRDKVLQKPK